MDTIKKDEEFWRNIILLEEQGKKLSFLMQEYGFNRTNFYYWKKKLCKTQEEISQEEAIKRLHQVEKEKTQLEIENDILKKAISIIGKK